MTTAPPAHVTEMREALTRFFSHYEDVEEIRIEHGNVKLTFVDFTGTMTPQIKQDLDQLLTKMTHDWHWPWSPKDKIIIVIARSDNVEST